MTGTVDGAKSSLSKVQWASRVNPKLIRRLYQMDASASSTDATVVGLLSTVAAGDCRGTHKTATTRAGSWSATLSSQDCLLLTRGLCASFP